MKEKLIRITTIPLSLEKLLGGQLHFMSEYYEVIAVSSDEKYLQQIGQKEKVKVYHTDLTRKITPLKDLKALWKLYRFFKKEKPTIVHTHTPKAGIIGMLAAKLAFVPYRLHTVAGLPLMEASGLKRNILDAVERLTYQCATKVYPNSKGLYDFIVEHNYAKTDKLKVIANGSSNGIDTTYFSLDSVEDGSISTLKQELGILPSDFVFVFVGRLVGDKGINELVKAFSILNQKETSLKLLLVGPLESDLDPLEDDTLNEIKINPSILTVGMQNDVRPYFAMANALVFPSYREGFPNVVMQAGAMGLPAIVSNINGCNEIIQQNANGLIVPSKDIDLLYTAMERLYQDPVFYSALKANARTMVTSRYEQKVVWNALLNEYNNLKADV
ncbi:glycosyltransferase family 4 protein [Pedobacter sp. UC225_65]|uniref:glycosyltransferase family 4 protein n=1 Tax=Pedobacter sp. UC225_65 TaxID=3350173 RepID=UPI00367072B2